MRTILFSSLCSIIMLFIASGCKSEPPLSAPEEDLKISIDAPSYTTTPAADFSFNLNIESKIPVDGVKVEYNVKSEIDNQSYSQGPVINTQTSSLPITISNLPRQKICICTVMVTSRSKSTNTAMQSFRVIYK